MEAFFHYAKAWLLWLWLELQELIVVAQNKNFSQIKFQHILAIIAAYLLWRYVIAPILARIWLWLRFHNRIGDNRWYFGRIIRVLDGDTVEVRRGITGLFQTQKVRMRYIDAPEKTQNHGNKTRFFIWQHGKGNTVLLICAKNNDKYGRVLAEIFCTHLRHSLNYTLVSHGWAWAYQANKYYNVAQQTAQRKRIGVWRDKNPINPSDYRKSKR